MNINQPIEPTKRIEILDILRGFALLGIIFMNMSFFSGYVFVPFDELKEISNFKADEALYWFLGVFVTGKFYTVFSILFAVGFYVQFNKNRDNTISFLKTYRRRLFLLLMIGVVHTLFWYGDILLTYATFGFILVLYRNVKPKNLLRWSLFFLFSPFLIDFALLPFTEALLTINPANTGGLPIAHAVYPDMENQEVISIFREGSVFEVFKLNIHNFIWKNLSYIPSGGYLKFLGIFLLGYYLASVDFFRKKQKSTMLILSLLMSGIAITITSKLLGGSAYAVPTLHNIRFKFLSLAGQLLMSMSYIMALIKFSQSSTGRKNVAFLIPVGRMALTNYIVQTVLMILIFYNFGFSLFGKIGLIPTFIIAVTIVIMQVIFSNVWLKHYRFGPFEWLWRSLTYKKRINIRY